MPKSVLDLEIIILNYNTQFWLKKVLSSLEEFYLPTTKYKVRVTVVDNNSQDDSVAMVRRLFKTVNLVALSTNDGFAAGNNVALKTSTARYQMLLNSDVEFGPLSNLDILLEYLDEHPKVGVITPRVNLPSGELDPASHRGEPTPWASFTYFSGLSKLFPTVPLFSQYQLTNLNLDEIHPIMACSGAAMIIRQTAMKKVGYLDEQFFMYAEDLDWCKRFREAGYQIIFHPGAIVTHHKYKSGLTAQDVQVKRKTSAAFYDTMLQYYDKHYRTRYPEFVRVMIQLGIHFKKGGL